MQWLLAAGNQAHSTAPWGALKPGTFSEHRCGCPCLQVEISKTYGRAEWREDLKRVTRRVGAEGKRVVFLFSDTQIKDEAFLEDINNMLNAGEVPNMFPQDEKMQVSTLGVFWSSRQE